MNSVKTSLWLFIIAFLFMNAKCNNEKLTYKESSNLNIVHASTQLQIPGQQFEKPTIEIEIQLKDLSSNITLDSIYYQQKKALKLSRSGLYWRTKLTEQQANVVSEYNGVSLKGKIVLFYTENNNNTFTIIDKITKKEPVYLP